MTMKKLFFVSTFSLFAIATCFAQKSNDEKAISTAVHHFAANADQQDVKKMAAVLDDNFRAVVNRLFGSKEVSIMDKSLYLQLLKDKKIGGSKRDVTILTMNITNNNAAVKAQLVGKNLLFTTYLLLVKNEEGDWKIVNDMPFIEKV